jgi:glycosyltransferase involved in cell wall biosynthesis
MNSLTIVYIYRNRDLERVKRTLDSLKKQTVKDFSVIFIDYGSNDSFKQGVQKIVEEYSFCKYVYNDSRGMPWNRSHALNTGIRLTETDFVFTADIDMIFETHFVETLMAEKEENAVTFFSVNYLPQNFSDWNNPKIKIYEESKNFALGLALLPVKVLNKLRGYDEFYCFWGQEDNDMQHRLEKARVQTKFYNSSVLMHHQWHPSSTLSEKELPAGWRVLQKDYFLSKSESIIRNEGKEWGKLLTEKDRPSLKLLDAPPSTFEIFGGSRSFFMYELNKQFNKLPVGTSLSFEFNDINSMIHQDSRLGKTIAFLQSLLDKLKIPVEVVSKYRNLYTSEYEVRDVAMVFILALSDQISDYCFSLEYKKFKLVVFKKQALAF